MKLKSSSPLLQNRWTNSTKLCTKLHKASLDGGDFKFPQMKGHTLFQGDVHVITYEIAKIHSIDEF